MHLHVFIICYIFFTHIYRIVCAFTLIQNGYSYNDFKLLTEL